MKRKVRILVLLLSLPLWLFAAGLLLEIILRLHADLWAVRNIGRINEIADAYRADDDIVFQEIKAAVTPPDTVLWRAPARDTILKTGETERFNLARERKEMILTCDVEGIIGHIYPCNRSGELDAISKRLSPGDSLSVILPPPEFADALTLIHQSEEHEAPGRDYPIPLGEGNEYLAECNAIRIAREPPEYAMFLGDSRYLEFMRKYRPNIYRRDWYMAQFNHSEFWTNRRGFRDREFEIPKPAECFRIVCIGGSTTVEGPHNDLTYPKVLEKNLREYFNSSHIEVINCGVDGLGFPNELDRMEDWLALQPDIILHYNIINNASWMILSATEKAMQEDGFMDPIYRMAAESKLIEAIGLSHVYPHTSYFKAELDNTAFSCFIRMEQMAREAGVLMAIASFAIPDSDAITREEQDFFESTFHLTPTKGGKLSELRRLIDEYNRLVREFCSQNNVIYIPVAENLTGGIETFTDICHLRVSGIRKKAAICFEHLRDVLGQRL
ncbi:MAG: SGNH/GDSL hydrolase family protein [Candidatus Hydrogenedentes bacterium]|nr:SGNH/GDSL hydrolase family protein [Candidatus Hydrogenedentota bacterium]